MTDSVMHGISSTTGNPAPVSVTDGAEHVAEVGTLTSDQGADLSVSTTALSGGAGVQAISTGTKLIRFQLKPIATIATTSWASIKFGDSTVIVTSSTGTTYTANQNSYIVPVPSGATHFDVIAGESLVLNWTPA